jgi:hypothetical protein
VQLPAADAAKQKASLGSETGLADPISDRSLLGKPAPALQVDKWLGEKPSLGRDFTPEDDKVGALDAGMVDPDHRTGHLVRGRRRLELHHRESGLPAAAQFAAAHRAGGEDFEQLRV